MDFLGFFLNRAAGGVSLQDPPTGTVPGAFLAGQEGFEPPSPGFGDRCSSRSSYWPKIFPTLSPDAGYDSGSVGSIFSV